MSGAGSGAKPFIIDGLVVGVSPDAGEETVAVVVDDDGRSWSVIGDLGDLQLGAPVRLFTRDDGGARRVVDYELQVPAGAAAIERFTLILLVGDAG